MGDSAALPFLMAFSALLIFCWSIRVDYLDFCLNNINSTRPCAIRVLSLKHAYRQSLSYPELISELLGFIEIMGTNDIPKGLEAAKKEILKKIKKS